MGRVNAITLVWLSGMTYFSSVTYASSTSSKTISFPSLDLV
jgi:hypothetical protein